MSDAKRYYNPISFTATATGAATNYPASNVENQYIKRPWRTPDTAGDTLTLTISSNTPTCVFVIGTNAPTLTFGGNCYSNDDVVSSVAYFDGVRAALSKTNLQAGTSIDIKPSGTPTDGASYYEIGAVYIMESSANIRRPGWGLAQEFPRPQIARDLANGEREVFSTGPKRCIIRATWEPQYSEDVEQMFRDSGVQILDMQDSNRPEYMWPVEWVEPSHSRSTPGPARDEVPFTFRRVN